MVIATKGGVRMVYGMLGDGFGKGNKMDWFKCTEGLWVISVRIFGGIREQVQDSDMDLEGLFWRDFLSNNSKLEGCCRE